MFSINFIIICYCKLNMKCKGRFKCICKFNKYFYLFIIGALLLLNEALCRKIYIYISYKYDKYYLANTKMWLYIIRAESTFALTQQPIYCNI